jgi:hypothetical protein
VQPVVLAAHILVQLLVHRARELNGLDELLYIYEVLRAVGAARHARGELQLDQSVKANELHAINRGIPRGRGRESLSAIGVF